jgi:hypothetical protein
MPPKNRIRYGQLHNYLESLGYHAESGPTYLVYRNPDTRLPIFLPNRPRSEDAWPPHLVMVQHTLELEDVVRPGHLYFAINGPPPARKPKAASPKAARPKAAGAKTAKRKATTKAAKAGGS